MSTLIKNLGFVLVFFVALGLFGVMAASFAGVSLFGPGQEDDAGERGFAPSYGGGYGSSGLDDDPELRAVGYKFRDSARQSEGGVRKLDGEVDLAGSTGPLQQDPSKPVLEGKFDIGGDSVTLDDLKDAAHFEGKIIKEDGTVKHVTADRKP